MAEHTHAHSHPDGLGSVKGKNLIITMVLKIVLTIAEGDKVAFRVVVRAVHTGEFNGIPVCGKSVTVPVIGMAKIADEKNRGMVELA